MAIAINTLTFGNTNSTSSSYTSASIAPSSNALIVLFIESHDSGGNPPDPTSVLGNGIAYSKLDGGTFFNGGYGTWLYYGLAASPSSGVVTFTFPGARPQDNCAWWIVEFTGVITTGTNGSGAIGLHNNFGAFPGSSVSGNLGSLTSGSATFGGCYGHNDVGDTITPGSGFTKYGQQHGFSDGNTTAAVEYNLSPGSGTVDFSFTSTVTLGLMAMEILASGGVPPFDPSTGAAAWLINPDPLPPPGKPRMVASGHVSTTRLP